jgi:predicted RNA binding protein YcfA (HicA-like mRNA interferase family)
VRALEREGWTRIRQTGSHVRLERHGFHVTVPLHRPVKRGTLVQILADAKMTADELRNLL